MLMGDRILRIADDPVTALLPWVVFALLPGLVGFGWAVFVSLAMALALVAIALFRGEAPKIFELADVALFGGLLVVSFFPLPQVDAWFEAHGDLFSLTILAALAFVTIAIGKPFTSPYTTARFQDLDPEFQRRLDRRTTAAWGVAFLIAALVAYYGEYQLHTTTNIWTSWILQILPVLIAFDICLWLDRRAFAREENRPEQMPSKWSLARDMSLWIAPAGLAALIVGPSPIWFSLFLIVVGVALFTTFTLANNRAARSRQRNAAS